MISSALNIAASSLKAQQKAIDVVSHNMANVNTPGYTRQRVEIGTAQPQQLGDFNFGRGVDLNNVSRLVDTVVNQAMLKNAPQQNYWQELQSGLKSIENVFGSLQSTGLSAAVDDFFLAAQQMANAPEDVAQKFNLRTKSTTLVSQISNMSAQLKATQQNADANINQNLQSANTLLTQIASLNIQISQHEVGSQGGAGAANDLRDQRDQAVRNLSTFLPLQDVRTSDGGVLLQTMGGDLLVQDGTAQQLTRGAVAAGRNFQSIVIAGSNTSVSGLDQGGKIGGAIALRDNRLGGYIADIDSMAVNLSFAINQANASGVGSSRLSQVQSGLGVLNATLPVSDAAQNNSFSTQIQ
ncbi:MAG: flagellar hook-associated protein FlgK, partial [Mariprofundaceae bacterium]|nr:flagellar hook-associated protein FlgK [Mariprofundaceae bacterium]